MLSVPTQAVSNLDESAPLDDPQSLPSDDTDSVMGQLVFGNDIDAVDIAVRVAMVKFFTSPNILGGIKEHTRTLRLFSRPVVALQRGPFLKSRTNMSEFVLLLSESQVNNQYQRNERCHAIRMFCAKLFPMGVSSKKIYVANRHPNVENQPLVSLCPSVFY